MRSELLFERFEVRALLGSGGFGRVFRCHDRLTDAEVALKELHRFGADALLSFKNEFRALADVHHVNLARLHELFEQQGRWAFSLEYVPGSDFLAWVRPDGQLDTARLRAALAGLCQGLSALHSIGLVHRDVKPANVRVTPEGRVVLLDFGLVTHLASTGASAGSGLGTAAYMAPEQARDERVGEAADFYAMGTLLYESLTGELPFEGSALDVLLRKQAALPVPPNRRDPALPADLSELCMALLSPWPEARPDAGRVLATLAHATPSIQPLTSAVTSDEPFVGRRSELVSLHGSCARALAEGVQLVLIEGESGAGKSALMQRFTEQVRERLADALLLHSRCHYAEQLPYKAFDGAVDELAGELRTLSLGHARMLMPDDAHLLPFLFPVLGLVGAVARAGAHAELPRIERYPLFRAFIELLRNVAAERPVVLAIDDLQWCDVESLALLESLLESPEPPRLMVVATLRPADADAPRQRRVLELLAHPRVARLSLGSLADGDARALAAQLLGREASAAELERIVADARGQPFLLVELARRADGVGAADLGSALRARFAELAPRTREVLEVTCVAGSPLGRPTLSRALALPPTLLEDSLAELRLGRLLRPLHDGRLVSYHDRIRDSLLAGLGPGQLRDLHRRLAEACAGADELDAARIAYHHGESDEPARAAPWLVRAAREAAGLAAFERAAELYERRLALAGAPLEPAERHQLELARAEALASAGRASEAARVLLGALEHTSGDERRELLARAAQRQLQAGEVEAGLATARAAFAASGLRWPGTRAATVATLVYDRLALKLSPLHPRRGSGAPRRGDGRLLVGSLLWQPLLWADWLRGAQLVERQLRLALASSDPHHVPLALQAHAVISAMQGSAEAARAVLAATESWSGQEPGPELLAVRDGVIGMCQVGAGQLRDAEQSFEAAERRLREHCPSESWQLVNARGLLLQVWRWRGRYRDLVAAHDRWLDEARVRGDRFAETTYTVTGYGCYRWLMEDDPDAADAAVEHAMQLFRSQGFGIQHLAAMRARHLIAAYRDIEAPAALWRDTWPAVRGSLLLRSPIPRELITFYRAQAELGSATRAEGARRAAHLSAALALLRPLRRARSRTGMYLGPYAEAQAALLLGNREQAAALGSTAQQGLETMGHVWAKFAGLVVAAASGREAYDAERARVIAFHASQGFRNPARAVSLAMPICAWIDRSHGVRQGPPAPRADDPRG